jgi:hypothetical protein
MNTYIVKNKLLLTLIILMVIISIATPDAYARGGRYYRHGDKYYYRSGWFWFGAAATTLALGSILASLPYERTTVFVGGVPYYYYDGIYYRPCPGGYMVVSAPFGAVIPTIPQGYPPVVVDGVAYYNINGVTYMYTPYGYQVVPAPQAVVNGYPVVQNGQMNQAVQNVPVTQGAVSTAANTEEAFTVNIPNSKGGYTPVLLKRSGNGFIGPQGEYYTEFPKIEQLKVMYGKQ